MSFLEEWAALHNVSAAALFDLRVRMGTASMPELVVKGQLGSESRQQSLVRLDAVENGVWLTRNNVGVLLNERGTPIRFGIANETPQQNKVVKSGDLLGIKPILIGPQHIGSVIGQFVSRECKKDGWKFNPNDKHEAAQLNWANFVISKGGDAAFATGPGSFNYRSHATCPLPKK